MNESLKIRPYARLLTMLGDQLIKNEQIAVIELIKNSYDADADWVKVSFENFSKDYKVTPSSRIVIEDNGTGMTKTIIEKSWMNPATPNKFSRDGKVRKTALKKRIIQGEKGIGRYAMLKLGKTIDLTTRAQGTNNEYSLCFDLKDYDDNFLSQSEQTDDLYLDSLEFNLITTSPSVFTKRRIDINNQIYDDNEHGTRIVISNLRGTWNKKKIEGITDSFFRFENLFDEIIGEHKENASKYNFNIGLYFDGEFVTRGKDNTNITLKNLFETQSVIKITNGLYDSSQGLFIYNQNDIHKELSIEDSAIKGNRVFRDHFSTLEDRKRIYRPISDFGDFKFDFYIFDFNAKEPSKYALVEEAKKIVKRHRVYLLRDEIRVLPYGDPEDDWLQVDISRGTISAGSFFSNDQIIGRIKITKFGNSHLKDKTNREGLIDDENYTSDFICIIRTFLSYLRIVVYKKYLDDNKEKDKIENTRQEKVEKEIKDLKEHFKENKEALGLIGQLEKSYKIERKYLETRAKQTESLAAVGLSVETSSHDIMLMLNQGVDELMALTSASTLPNFNHNNLTSELQKLIGIFSYVKNQMKDMQLLFTSSKQRRKQIRIKDILDKVVRIYKRTLDNHQISVEIILLGSPLVATCTDADLLQLFINLFDNSIYWMDVKGHFDKKIHITLDGDSCQMIFSDNGPGIREDDIPYIFEPFYSTKGIEGRGLGLYISRKLMERNDYFIDLANIKSEKVLEGANFVVTFIKQDNNEY